MKLPWGMRETDPRCITLKNWISEQIEELYLAGYRRFLCGMAIGCDFYFANAVLSLRSIHPEITLEAAVPCPDQSDKWTKKQKTEYMRLIDACDSVTVLSPVYTKECMMQRNRYMVDRSSLLLACFNGQASGTMNTIVYAQRSFVETRIIEI